MREICGDLLFNSSMCSSGKKTADGWGKQKEITRQKMQRSKARVYLLNTLLKNKNIITRKNVLTTTARRTVFSRKFCTMRTMRTNEVRSTARVRQITELKSDSDRGTGWTLLVSEREELSLMRTLPTGQSFRWKEVKEVTDDVIDEEYVTFVGVIGERIVKIRERGGVGDDDDFVIEYRVMNESDDRESCNEEIRTYFNLDNEDLKLKELFDRFSKADPKRFGVLRKFVIGARTLRQSPVECLISFVCSSNNNIARIRKMVDSLCEKYGEKLECSDSGDLYYAFPTVDALAEKCEERALRELGFGYRAKFIPAIAQELQKRGGEKYLLDLRKSSVDDDEWETALTTLPGVGPKVASCAALFSLDKNNVIPVDTHVWQLAREHYDDAGELSKMESTKTKPKKATETTPTSTPTKTKQLSITPKMMAKCSSVLQEIYGDYAGWAQTALFVAELPQIRETLPQNMQTPTKAQKRKLDKTVVLDSADALLTADYAVAE